MKILVIEDEVTIRDSISRILRAQGYDVFSARDGLFGLETAKEELPDLILCDVMMPGMNGFKVLEELRGNPLTEAIPLIFLSAKGDRPSLRQGMELGADDYIPKPFKIDELLGTIKARMKKQGTIEKKIREKMDSLRSSITLSLPHELLTPLNSILGFSRFLADNHSTIDRKKIFRLSTMINEQAQRLQRTISNYLYYAELELAASKTRGNKIYEGSILVKNTIMRSAEKKAAEMNRKEDLTMDVEDGPVKVSDKVCTKIIEELLDNAFKFSSKGADVFISGRLNEKSYNISVIDKGTGMTEEDLSHLDACIQLNRSINEQQGAGLGLSIVKRLVEFSSGEIFIESTAGKGTEVKLSFPLQL